MATWNKPKYLSKLILDNWIWLGSEEKNRIKLRSSIFLRDFVQNPFELKNCLCFFGIPNWYRFYQNEAFLKEIEGKK